MRRIHVMGADRAKLFVPQAPTYAIRLLYTPPRHDYGLSGDFEKVFEYEFDGVGDWVEEKLGRKKFDHGLARKIITDFRDNRHGCEELLVHCKMGINRSPAVAIGLSEIFGYTKHTIELMREFSGYNVSIVETMFDVVDKEKIVA